MRDKSKKLTVVNTDKRKESAASSTPVVVAPRVTSSSSGFIGGDYLLKSIWDSVFEIKTDTNGEKYIFGKLPVVTRYGVTMYSDNGSLDIPSIYDGLPIDNSTLVWKEGVLMVNPDIELGGASTWDELEGKPSWIGASKPVYQYSEIQNKPDLSKYVSSEELKKYVTLEGYQEIDGVKNFMNGLQIAGMPITKLQDDIIYIDSNVVIRGGLTMYYESGDIDLPSIKEEIGNSGYDGAVGLAAFDSTQFVIATDGTVSIIGGSTGLDYEALQSYLTSNSYATQSWVNEQGYASASLLSALQETVNNFLEGSDTDTIINKWKELEAFLEGLSESDNLAEILATKWTTDNTKIANWDTAYSWGNHASVGYALKSYVDDTFVTIVGTEDVTGIHAFVNGLKIGDIMLSKSQEGVIYLEGNLVVKGGVTMYAENEVDIPSILDSLPIASNTALGIASFDSTYFSVDDNGMVTLTSAPSTVSTLGSLLNVDVSLDSTATVDRVLYQAAGSSTWTWKELTSSGVVGDYLPLSGGTINGNSGLDLIINTSYSEYNLIGFKHNNTYRGYVGVEADGKIGLYSYVSRCYLGINSSGEPYVQNDKLNQIYTILHSGNYSSYALPLSGGTLAQGSQNITLTVQSTMASSDWITPIRAFAPNVQKGGHCNIEVGKAGTARNLSWFGFKYDSDGSYNNLLTIGLHSVDDALVINGYGYVGIGTTSPSYNLHVAGNTKTYELYVEQKIRFTKNGEYFDSWGNIYLSSTAANWNVFNNAGTQLFVVNVNGNVLAAGGITMYSDIRKKTKLQDVELTLSQIANAPLIEHYYNSDDKKTTHVGSIAQYWAGLNDWFCKLDNEGYYTMEIQNCALASAISIARHLEKYENKTDKKIRQLKKRINQLEDELELLKKGE